MKRRYFGTDGVRGKVGSDYAGLRDEAWSGRRPSP